MLSEETQISTYPISNHDKSETESLPFVIPPLAEIKPTLIPSQFPESPWGWMGNQATFDEQWKRMNCLLWPSTRRTRSPSKSNWISPAGGLDAGKTGNSYSQFIMQSNFPPSERYQNIRQNVLDCDLRPRGSRWYNVQQSTATTSRWNEHVRPGGGFRVSNVHHESGTKRKNINWFKNGKQKKQTRKPEHHVLAYNNRRHSLGDHSHNQLCQSKKVKSVSRREYARQRQFARSRRKGYSSGISTKDLMFFTNSIGFKSLTGSTHQYICELLDFIIDTKRVYQATTCPAGSKFLQHQIINANWTDFHDILQQVMEKLVTICNDQYGNYVVQCFFKLSDPAVWRKILMRIRSSIRVIAMNQYGCRVLQRVISEIDDVLFRIVIDAISRRAWMLAVHNFGCHVLHCTIVRGSGEIVKILLEKASGRRRKKMLIELSKSAFGCRIVKSMLENAFPGDREIIIEAIMGMPRILLLLCMDEFGNYVIQHIVEHFKEKHSMAVMKVLDSRILEMAKNKFCSNVLEVLYKKGGREVQDRLIKLVDLNFLQECLNDRFANYLVQTMLTEGDPRNRKKILNLLLTIPYLQKLTYGKFVTYRLSKMKRTMA